MIAPRCSGAAERLAHALLWFRWAAVLLGCVVTIGLAQHGQQCLGGGQIVLFCRGSQGLLDKMIARNDRRIAVAHQTPGRLARFAVARQSRLPACVPIKKCGLLAQVAVGHLAADQGMEGIGKVGITSGKYQR